MEGGIEKLNPVSPLKNTIDLLCYSCILDMSKRRKNSTGTHIKIKIQVKDSSSSSSNY